MENLELALSLIDDKEKSELNIQGGGSDPDS